MGILGRLANARAPINLMVQILASGKGGDDPFLGGRGTQLCQGFNVASTLIMGKQRQMWENKPLGDLRKSGLS